MSANPYFSELKEIAIKGATVIVLSYGLKRESEVETEFSLGLPFT
jgi:hypothetical protein